MQKLKMISGACSGGVSIVQISISSRKQAKTFLYTIRSNVDNLEDVPVFMGAIALKVTSVSLAVMLAFCGINPQRKEVYPQDLKRVRVSVVRIRKREGKGR